MRARVHVRVCACAVHELCACVHMVKEALRTGILFTCWVDSYSCCLLFAYLAGSTLTLAFAVCLPYWVVLLGNPGGLIDARVGFIFLFLLLFIVSVEAAIRRCSKQGGVGSFSRSKRVQGGLQEGHVIRHDLRLGRKKHQRRIAMGGSSYGRMELWKEEAVAPNRGNSSLVVFLIRRVSSFAWFSSYGKLPTLDPG